MHILPTVFFILLTATAFSQSNAACDLNLGPDVLVCNNAQFTLNPNPIPGAYLWSGSTGLSCLDCPSPDVSGLVTGVYTYIATVTTPDCTGADTLIVTVINGQAPQYEISEDRVVCAGDTVQLGGAPVPGTFYNWFSAPAGFGSFMANPSTVPPAPTTYYLSVSASSCPVPLLDSVKITPVLLELQLVPTDTVRLCRGRSRTLQATVNPTGQTLTWTPATDLQINANGTTAVATPLTSTLYSVTASIAGCVRQRQVYFAVDSLPADLKIRPADTTICQGAEVLLQSPAYEPGNFPGTTFRWTRTPQTTLLTPDSLLNLLVQPNQTTVYRRITRFGVCADTAMAMVHVVPTPQMTVTPASSTICPGDSVTIKLTYTPGVTNIAWSPVGGLSCSVCDSVVVRPAVSTTYSITGNLQGCPVNASATVNLNPLAPLQFPGKLSICLGDTVLLNTVFDPLATYIWTSTHPGFGTVALPDPRFRPTQTATYFVTTNNGCIGRDSVRIEVSTATLTASNDTTICKNAPLVLSAATSIPGTDFYWLNGLTGQVAGTVRTLPVQPAQTTPYIAFFSYGDGCQLTDTVTVTIAGEAPLLVFPADRQLCPGENLTLNLGPVLPGAEYTWTANPPDPTLVFDDAAPVVSPAQNTTYTVTATLDNCVVTHTVAVIAYSATLTVTPDTTICAGSQVVLTALGSDPNGRYAWNTGEAGAGILKFPTGDTAFAVTYTFGDTCALRDTVRVTVLPTFMLDIQCVPDTNAIDIGASLTLTAAVTPPQNLGNFTFVWQESTVDTKTLPFSTESIDVTPASNDTAVSALRYTLIATAPNGCMQVAEKTFRLIFPLVRFPNAFTPDGDGNNDQFRMVVLEGRALVEQFEIFNRWGGKIFESTDPDAAWDGTSNGKPVPSDVYVFRIQWRRGDGALQPVAVGDVTVLR
ncbi:MAG: gliding motility-associated C-terminal domain-containing protein [Lewinellaceae bacterium]|nr:gliding motility-associated C-terminal domain-containing protein [Lewinellaceae bacterium]